ncbi:hypothetical protein BY458DRAFT_525891 [Sporodiniella umbellata]|nr:hypothetical protein BY458DRAFT_525891 [Sporodiniella umbellata]
MFRSLKPLEKQTLSLIGQTHGPSLVHMPRGWTSLSLSLLTPYGPSEDMLRFVAAQFPAFIVRLDLAFTQVGDEHIHLLRSFCHLQSLELSNVSRLSDTGVLYLSALSLPVLKQLALCDNPGITDRCLSHVGRLDTLEGVDLTHTLVNHTVADIYLTRLGFVQTARKVDQIKLSSKLHGDIRLMHVPRRDSTLPDTQPRKQTQLTHQGPLYFQRQTHKRKRQLSPEKTQSVKPTLDDFWTSVCQEFT